MFRCNGNTFLPSHSPPPTKWLNYVGFESLGALIGVKFLLFANFKYKYKNKCIKVDQLKSDLISTSKLDFSI